MTSILILCKNDKFLMKQIKNNDDKPKNINLQYKNLKNLPYDLYLLKNITKLNCNYNFISKNINGLNNCPNLTHLSLIRNDISIINGFERCVNLVHLELTDNTIKNISGLNTLINLKILYLDNNLIYTISGLENCVKLEKLYLNINVIEKINGLDKCIKLKNLYLMDNNITTIGTELDNCINLEVLNLSRNRFKITNGFVKLINLKELYLSRGSKCGKIIIAQNAKKLIVKYKYQIEWIDYYVILAIINTDIKTIYKIL